MSEETKPITRLIDAIETAYGEMLSCDGVGDVYPHLLAARKAAEVIEFRERVEANLQSLFDAVNDIERRLEVLDQIDELIARTERAIARQAC